MTRGAGRLCGACAVHSDGQPLRWGSDAGVRPQPLEERTCAIGGLPGRWQAGGQKLSLSTGPAEVGAQPSAAQAGGPGRGDRGWPPLQAAGVTPDGPSCPWPQCRHLTVQG